MCFKSLFNLDKALGIREIYQHMVDPKFWQECIGIDEEFHKFLFNTVLIVIV